MVDYLMKHITPEGLMTYITVVLKVATEPAPKYCKKSIPHMGDTESLDQCRWYHHCHEEKK